MQRVTNSGCTLMKVAKSVMPRARMLSSSERTALKSSTHSDTGERSNRLRACFALSSRRRCAATRSVTSSSDTSTRLQESSWPGSTRARTRTSSRRPSSA